MTDFLISDTHAFHKNIIKGCSEWSDTSKCRPFSSIDEHNTYMANKINSVVQPNDRIIHAGDWSFGGIDKVKMFRDMINCKNIELLYGNHDTHIMSDPKLQKLFNRCDLFRTMKLDGQMVVICHYALQVWENNHRGWFMLHGHSHGNLNHDNDGKILDLCVENHDYTPWSMDEIKDYMSSREIVAKDHH